ncbi:MAG: M20/M25/M40 family metallo-hydrolase, partial [Clostridia bacterium]|nr:M20/M25/M40 family metallo-hydrolase [Clostridia bacterium]
PIVMNNEIMTEKFKISAAKVVGEENIFPRGQGMGGEDFAYFANLKPGVMFELGIRNEELGYTVGVHNGKFMLDESALEIGVNIFVQFILDNMNGIQF